MRKFQFALVVAAGAVLSSAASAADLGGYKDTPYVSVPNWSGLYFGGHAGGVWGNTNVTDTYDYIGDPTSKNSFSNTGLIAGGQVGYNVQRGHAVFGVEGDIGYLGLSGSKSAQLTPASDCLSQYWWDTSYCNLDGKYSVSGGLYGDLTGRLGYATDRVLFYAKGGVAFLDANVKAKYTGKNCTMDNTCGYTTVKAPSVFDFDHSDTMVGWTVGAGAEFALSRSWSVKLEYQHFDFGSMAYNYDGCYKIPNTSSAACPTHNYASNITGKNDVSVTADAVQVGLNYHVGGDR